MGVAGVVGDFIRVEGLDRGSNRAGLGKGVKDAGG